MSKTKRYIEELQEQEALKEVDFFRDSEWDQRLAGAWFEHIKMHRLFYYV